MDTYFLTQWHALTNYQLYNLGAQARQLSDQWQFIDQTLDHTYRDAATLFMPQHSNQQTIQQSETLLMAHQNPVDPQDIAQAAHHAPTTDRGPQAKQPTLYNAHDDETFRRLQKNGIVPISKAQASNRSRPFQSAENTSDASLPARYWVV